MFRPPALSVRIGNENKNVAVIAVPGNVGTSQFYAASTRTFTYLPPLKLGTLLEQTVENILHFIDYFKKVWDLNTKFCAHV